MKTLPCTAAALILAAAVAAPASGQTPPDSVGAVLSDLFDTLTPGDARRLSMDERQRWLDRRIAAGVRDGTLTRTEARRLRDETRDLARLERSYRRGGLNGWEHAELDRRFDNLSARVYRQRSDDDGRWAAINERQQRLDARIDAGVRRGDLTASEARTLRRDFRDLARLETRYRSSGLSGWERADLDRRFDALSARIRDQRNDAQDRAWVSVNARQAELDRRIDAGIRNGALTAREGERLHAEFRAIARLEEDYRRSNGLSAAERADLDGRLDALGDRIRVERYDRQASRR